MPVFATFMLGLAGLVTAGLVVPVFIVPPTQGYNGLGELLLMVAAATLRWVVLAALLAWGLRTSRFAWVPGGSTGVRALIVMGGHAVLGGLSLMALLAVADTSILRGLPPGLGRVMHQVAQIGCTLPAVATIAGLAAVSRPGPVEPPMISVFGGAAGGLAGLILVGALVGQDIADTRSRAARDAQQAADSVAEDRRRFESLTDADPLLRWDEFVHSDVSEEALRRLARRPTLEHDLIEALGCDCRNPNWTAELLWMVGAIPFEPSADLAGPARQAIDILAADLRASADRAYAEQRDTYVDLYHTREIETVRVVAAKLARTAGVDLRPSLHAMRSAVVEQYPRSEAARRYPAEVDRTEAEIATALRGR